MPTDARRALPSVTALLSSDALRPLREQHPHGVVVDAIRRAIEAARTQPAAAPRDEQAWHDAVAAEVAAAVRPSLRPVLNGTGVVLHTNLGRAPLAEAAIDAIHRVASGFSNLELDLETGGRGSRHVHCTPLLRELTGAEDALVVNNGAAGLVLALNTVAEQRDVIVSRGELVEIGGSFRIPDIMAKSGARLVDVGTTNRTHLDDYRRVLGPNTGAIVKVHRSNFAVAGFVSDVSAAELAALASEHQVPLLHDLGSGLLADLSAFGLTGEPTARDAIRAGATIVTMSGDKLLGGPQAGIVLGTARAIAAMRANPLARSYRVDKLTLAALEATLALYRDPTRALREIPALAQLTASVESLRRRAERIVTVLGASAVSATDMMASVGGGAFPTAQIPSVGLAIAGDAVSIERRLRTSEPPLMARVADDRVLIDLRTIFPDDDERVVALVRAALA